MAEKVADHVRLDTEVKVKKTRASKPKVKTGCQTCKFVFAHLSFSFAVPAQRCSLVRRGGHSTSEQFNEHIAKLFVPQLESGASSAMRPSPAVCAV